MPALGIDPRTGELIIIPDEGGGASGAGEWGPSLVRQRRQREEASSARSDASWALSIAQGYDRAREEAEQEAREELIRTLIGHPYMGMAIVESGVSPSAVIENPAIFSQVALLAFLKYQEDVKRAWQEGKGPTRPLTAREFVESILDLQGPSVFGYYLAPVGWDPTTGGGSFPAPSGSEQYVVQTIEVRPSIPDWLSTHPSFFAWATDEDWWTSDPDFQARFPEAAPGYGKVSPAPPGFQKVAEGVYEDPQTGFFYFSDTGAFLGHGFLGHWKENRDLGKPVTNEFSFNGKTYQVFENGVLSYDPNTGEIKSYQSVEEAGLDLETFEANRTKPKAWTATGQEIPLESHVTAGTWTTDPYLGTRLIYYVTNPASVLLPQEAPSQYPFAGYRDVKVTGSGVWVTGPNNLHRQPDYWMYERFIGKVKSDPELRAWYYSLSDRDKNQVFANYLMTGQVYL